MTPVHDARRSATIHPIVFFILPLTTTPVLLAWGRLHFLLLFLFLSLVILAFSSFRLFLRVAAAAIAAGLLFGGGFIPWIGWEAAGVIGLRAASLVVVIYGVFARIDWFVLSDSLIRYWRLPYPLVDVTAMGRRFVALMRRELAELSARLRVDARGNTVRWLISLPRVILPMLVAAFRQADVTALALESRGFASQSQRTTHYAQPIRGRDYLAIVVLTVMIWVGVAYL